MAKRFTETNKWDDNWFCSLSNDEKITWLYLLDKCSHAGVIQVNLRNLNFNCNTNYNDFDSIVKLFDNRLIMINESYAFIPKFLKYQYEKGITSKKPVIVSVRKELEKFDLSSLVSELLGEKFTMVDKPLNNDYTIVKDKDKDKSKDKDKDKGKSKDKESVIPLEVYSNDEFSFNSGYPANVQEVKAHADMKLSGLRPFIERCQEFYEQWEASGWKDSNLKFINWQQKLHFFLKEYDSKKAQQPKKERVQNWGI